MASRHISAGKRPVRVLLANDHIGFQGSIHGVGRFFLNIIPNFDPDLVQIVPVILRPRDELGALFDERGISVRFLGRHRFDPRTLLDLLRLIREERTDILHVQGYNADILGRIAGLLTGKPVILQQHDANAIPPQYAQLADRILSHTPSHTLAISDHVRDFLNERRAISEERISVLPMGVDISGFSPAEDDERTAARASFGLDSTVPCAGVLGRLHKIKGIIYLIRALPEIIASQPDFVLLVAGEGEERAVLQDEARQLGVAANVDFVGFQSDVRQFLAALDFLVIPSLSEGLCYVLLEGMAMGLCVIATNVGGMAEILKDSDAAILVPPGNPSALSAQCRRALRDKDFRQHIASRALIKAQDYSLERTITALTRIYLESCSGCETTVIAPEAHEPTTSITPDE